MNRRDALLGLFSVSAVTGALSSLAQQRASVPRIGLLANASPRPNLPGPIIALLDGLRALGYVDGQTISIEFRWAEGNPEKLAALASDLARMRVEVIVASGDAPTKAAMGATSTIPIVMATSGDAVGSGFVSSLARPGGNVTGMTAINPELVAKRLDLLRGLLPGISRIGILWNPNNTAHTLEMNASRVVAPTLRLMLYSSEVRAVEDIDDAIAVLVRLKIEALMVFADTTMTAGRSEILNLAARQRVPAMYEASEWVESGGLVAYGVTHADLFRQSASHVAKILKGARPADIPVEQPTRLRLAINMKTARSLNLSIPPSVLLRADRVIE